MDTPFHPVRMPAARAGIALLLVGLAACADGPAATEPAQTPAFAKAPAPSQGFAVISSLDGAGSIQAVGSVDYASGSGVSSVVDAVGDWVLDQTGRGSTRFTRLDLTDRAAGITAPFETANVQVRFIAKSAQLGRTFAAMKGGETTLSPLSLAFTYGGVSYGLRMNTANHPATAYALVTCTAPTDPTLACSAWRITPQPNADGTPGKTVAHLERVGTKASTPLGNVNMTFDIGVRR